MIKNMLDTYYIEIIMYIAIVIDTKHYAYLEHILNIT